MTAVTELHFPANLTEKLLLIDQPLGNNYAIASGDTNPIHRETEEAYSGPFGRPIAHGMILYALACQIMQEAFGQKWTTSGSISVKWRGPTLLPSEVRATGTLKKQSSEQVQYDIDCSNQDGETLLTGVAIIQK